MKKVLSIAIAFLLVFTGVVPAFADEESQIPKLELVGPYDYDYMYINDTNGNIVKYYPEFEEYEIISKEKVYFDIANKDSELCGVRSNNLYKLNDETNSIKKLGVNNVNSLTFNNGLFYFLHDKKLMSYDLSNGIITEIKDTGYQSSGDIVAFDGDLYFLAKENKSLIKIDFENNYEVSVVKSYDINKLYGISVVNNSLYIGYGNNVSKLNSNFEIESTFKLDGIGTINGMAQGGYANVPKAKNVVLNGESKVGETLTGDYTFFDKDGDNEGISQYKWYIDGTEIEGETNNTLIITDFMISKEIVFEVTPTSVNMPAKGNSVKSNSVTIESDQLEYNFWITADDYHDVYINGELLENVDKLWSTVDKYYLKDIDENDLVIAVKGWDRDSGTATISGFKAAYKKQDDSWVETDDSWQIYIGGNIKDTPNDYNGYKWFKNEYKGNWSDANIIEVPDSDWPKDDKFEGDAEWIWSENYIGSRFDSPVYFRNVLNEISKLDLSASSLDLSEYEVVESESTEVTVTLKDQYGNNINGVYEVKIFNDGSLVGTAVDNGDGTYNLNVFPIYGEINKISATVNSEEVVETKIVSVTEKEVVVNKTIEHRSTGLKDVPLESRYDKLVLLAQIRSYIPTEVGNLRNNILIGNLTDLINNTYSVSKQSFSTFAETIDGVKDFEKINYLALEAGVLKDKDNKIIACANNTVIDYNNDTLKTNPRSTPEWHTIDYDGNFNNPVVIAELSSRTGSNYTHIRVKNVTNNSFDLFLEEWDKFRGTNHHNHELVSYIVIEKGIHELSDGTFIEVIKSDDEESDAFTGYKYNNEYNKPSVFSQTQTYNDDNQVWIRQNNISNESVEILKQTDNGVHGEETVGIVVIGKKIENSNPAAVNDKANVNEDESIIINVLSNDTDPDGGEMNVIGNTEPSNGTVIFNEGEATYTPNANYNGNDSFTYTLNGGSIAIVNITVNSVNDNPTTEDVNETTNEETPKTLDVVTKDIDGDEITLTIETEPSNGGVVVNDDGTVTYTPNEEFNGVDEFKIEVNDGNGGTAISIVTIIVNEVVSENNNPEAENQSFEVNEDTSYEYNPNVATDVDGDVLTINEPTTPLHGNIVKENGNFIYTPEINFNGEDSFSYVITDGRGGEVTVEVSIIVNAVDDIPVAVDDTVNVDEDKLVVINVLSNDTDSDGGEMNVISNTDPLHGTVRFNENIATYTPTADYNGLDSFTYTLNGGSIAIVNITVKAVEDNSNPPSSGGGGGGGYTPPKPVNAPEAVTDSYKISTNSTISININELMENDKNAKKFESIQNAFKGTVNKVGDIITFTPDDNYIGRAGFYYTISNGKYKDSGVVIVDVNENEETIIKDEVTPLGSGNKNDEMILIDDGEVPLGLIEFYEPYIKGYPDGTFRIDKSISRAEMAAIFARILNLDLSNPQQQKYADVESDEWYYNYVQAVSNEGVFSGYTDGTFRPDQEITHAEMATVFSKYWLKKNIRISAESTDYLDIAGHWAELHINRFYNAGISVGYIDGTFRPDELTTRTDLVIMVNRVLNRKGLDKDIPTFTDVDQDCFGFGAIEAAVKGYIPLVQK